MSKFIKRTKEYSSSPGMQQLLNSHIHLVTSFPMVILEPEFVLACASHFYKETRTIKDDDGKVIIMLDPKTIDKIFKVLTPPTHANITIEKAQTHYNQNEESCKKNINTNWILKPRAMTTRWPKLYQSDCKEEINDMITLCSVIKL